MHCQPFTALFDIGREAVDGRGLESYIGWLQRTVQLFPNLVIFHEPMLDLSSVQGGRKIPIDPNKLKSFSFLPRVEDLFQTYRPIAKDDITFKLPKYSLVQYSKFELASILSKQSEATGLLWVDAGISRFVHKPVKTNVLEKNSGLLFRENYSAAFEIDVRNNLSFNPLMIAPSPVGSCRRVFSGTSFWINSGSADFLMDIVFNQMQLWLKDSIWDNEQVMLRNVLPFSGLKIRFIPQIWKSTGSVARTFSQKKLSKFSYSDPIFERLLSR